MILATPPTPPTVDDLRSPHRQAAPATEGTTEPPPSSRGGGTDDIEGRFARVVSLSIARPSMPTTAAESAAPDDDDDDDDGGVIATPLAASEGSVVPVPSSLGGGVAAARVSIVGRSDPSGNLPSSLVSTNDVAVVAAAVAAVAATTASGPPDDRPILLDGPPAVSRLAFKSLHDLCREDGGGGRGLSRPPDLPALEEDDDRHDDDEEDVVPKVALGPRRLGGKRGRDALLFDIDRGGKRAGEDGEGGMTIGGDGNLPLVPTSESLLSAPPVRRYRCRPSRRLGGRLPPSVFVVPTEAHDAGGCRTGGAKTAMTACPFSTPPPPRRRRFEY
jgi:hypothetical protein